MASKRPIKKFRSRGVEVAIWKRVTEKEGKKRNNFSTSVTKSYYSEEEKGYVETKFFFPEELAVLSILSAQAVAWISEQDLVPSEDEKSESTDEENVKGPF